MRCPNCSSSAGELLECDICNSVGCVKCVVKKNKQWVCNGCKGAKSTGTIFSMFGSK